jgi:predicted helicase
MDNLQDELYKIFLKSPINLFDDFILECQKWYEMPAHSFSEMRMRDNKKIRGDIFEEFCVLYLKYANAKGHKNVWLLKDVPVDILDKLILKRRDMGIDIIVETSDDKYLAVQCKYKKHTGCKLNILSWKALSTFYALCLRTGPWDKYIIMTNCVYTRHQGKKTSQDVSYCLKTLQNITKDEWLRMCNVSGVKIGSEEVKAEEATAVEKIEVKVEEVKKVVVKKVAKTKINPSTIIIPSKEEIRALRTSFYNI